jgi:hypothetical protein
MITESPISIEIWKTEENGNANFKHNGHELDFWTQAGAGIKLLSEAYSRAGGGRRVNKCEHKERATYLE